MFCDLVGSTSLAERLDPEDFRDIIRSYQDACAGAIMRFEGHVAKYLGDGVLAYFGWPQGTVYRSYQPYASLLVPVTEKLVKRILTLPTGTSISEKHMHLQL